MEPKPERFIVSWDGFLPVVGIYDEGVLSVNSEMNEWLFAAPEEAPARQKAEA